MHVRRLRYAFPRRPLVGEIIAFDNGHPVEVVREDPGRGQAGKASPYDNGVVETRPATQPVDTSMHPVK